MGKKLIAFYDEVSRFGGIKAKMRLAVITNIPSPTAISIPDSSENIAKFEKAFQEIVKHTN